MKTFSVRLEGTSINGRLGEESFFKTDRRLLQYFWGGNLYLPFSRLEDLIKARRMKKIIQAAEDDEDLRGLLLWISQLGVPATWPYSG